MDKLEESHSPEDRVGTQDAAEEATDPTDSFHPQEDCSTSVQEAGMQHLTSKELDEEAEAGNGHNAKSSKEMDVEAEGGSTGQVEEHHFKKKESGEESGEKDEVEAARKQMPRACKWLMWWKKRWPVSNNKTKGICADLLDFIWI